MEQKLSKLYNECILELKGIGIKVLNNRDIGDIEIGISKRNNKRYGVCKQRSPDEKTKYIKRLKKQKIIKYGRYNKHYIEISPWVMELEESIIKNTIIHEIIHCFPYCNDHGDEFKKYGKYINLKLGYDISRTGNKEEDYKKSNLIYKEDKTYNYKIECKECGQIIYRDRCNRDFSEKYRCGKCGGKFVIYKGKFISIYSNS